MYQVVNVREHSFTGDDDKIIRGKYVYLKRQDGGDAVRKFVRDETLKNFAYQPKPGDVVVVFWNDEGDRIVDMLKA